MKHIVAHSLRFTFNNYIEKEASEAFYNITQLLLVSDCSAALPHNLFRGADATWEKIPRCLSERICKKKKDKFLRVDGQLYLFLLLANVVALLKLQKLRIKVQETNDH
jgi:hypothetical protein